MTVFNHKGNRITQWLSHHREFSLPAAGLLIATVILSVLLLSGVGATQDASAVAAEETEAVISASPEETPAPSYSAGYLSCENGLFRPNDTLTAGEAADAVQTAAGLSVEPENSEEALTETTLSRLLADVFPEDKIQNAMDAITLHGGENVTRAEAAVFFDRLFSLNAASEENVYFPDVVPDTWGYGDICTAASGSTERNEENDSLPEGICLIDRRLYYVGTDGYFVRNAYVGSLYFDNSGRYTSGDAELDTLVLAALRENTDENMTREEMLHATYDYVRDSFSYLKRNYYKTGEVGWAMQEALTMYSTGRGNCYNYAAAFWAAARALGYDAKIVSGTYGDEDAPHGWVEITQDGVRYTYDVEIEMAVHRDNPGSNQSFYEMTDTARSGHDYKEADITDDMLPRSMNNILFSDGEEKTK